MKNNILFEGIYPAIFSIYDKNLNVINESIEKLVNYNLDSGVDGFYVGGNTGECTVLPARTRKQMLEAVCKYNNKRGKIICHVGAGHLEEVLELIEHANDMDIDAIASLPPSLTPYYKEDSIIEYYKIIAKASKHPVIAYVTPVLNCSVSWFVEEIMKIPNVVGAKLTISNYYEFGKCVNANGGNLNILNGPDETLLCGLVLGADGGVGTTYNLTPKVFCDLYKLFKAGDIEGARKKQFECNKIVNVLVGNNIACWKYPLKFLGIDPGHIVEPGILPSPEKEKEIKAKLEEVGFFDMI
ncbi:MAG: dihydrodipicolinate synthase family protein [Clostridia bacterium]|nr:dihydrodipicolinate synthase family protein [Clostridia bacterium]